MQIENPLRFKGIILLILVNIIGATTFPLTKDIVSSLSPSGLIATRYHHTANLFNTTKYSHLSREAGALFHEEFALNCYVKLPLFFNDDSFGILKAEVISIFEQYSRRRDFNYESISVSRCLCESLSCRGKTLGFKFREQMLRDRYGKYIADYLKTQGK